MLVKTLLVVTVVICTILFGTKSSTVHAISVTFNNGSVLVLEPQYFTGSWTGMQQNGLSPGQFDWEMSLVDPSTFNGNCPSAQYMAQGKTCDETKFGTAAYSATPNSDGSGVRIIFKATNGANQWQASLDIVCDPSQNTLFSPTNAYSASQPSTDIVVAWTLKSKGACLSSAAPPSPPTPAPPAPPTPPSSSMSVTFNNGSVLVLEPQYFTGSWQGMQQNGLSPGQHDWEMSLVDPSTFNGNCPSAFYIAQGKTCDETKFGTAAYSATPNSDGSGVRIIFKATNGPNQWQASLDIVCDPSQNTLFSPTNAYSASQPSTDIIVAWTLKSKGACLSSSTTTTTTTTAIATETSTATPTTITTSPGGNNHHNGNNNNTNGQNSPSSLSKGELIGFAAGGAFGGAVLAIGGFYLVKHLCKSKREATDADGRYQQFEAANVNDV